MRFGYVIKKSVPVFYLIFFIGIAWILKQELSQYDYASLNLSWSAIAKLKINYAIGLTFIGYIVIAHYDKIAFLAAKYPLKTGKILTTGFISYAICNTVGFNLVVGGGIRYYFYSYFGVPKEVIAKIIAFSNLNFWLGILAIGGIAFIVNPIIIPPLLKIDFLTTFPLGIIFLSLVTIYLYCSWQQKSITIKGKNFAFPTLSISLAQIVVSALDWAIASLVLYLLLPTNINLEYSYFFCIYLLAITARVISNIPGGLGIFETVILYFLPDKSTVAQGLSSLLIYRGIYFLLPLLTSCILLGMYKIKRANL